MIVVPGMGAGLCLEPEGNGVSLGEEGVGGPSPPRVKGDKQSVLNRGRDNMDEDKEERQPSVMKNDQREHSEPFFPKTRIL
jgi:hypothetical protein